MGKAVTLTNINKYRKDFNSSSTAKLSMNAATRTDVRKLAMNWEYRLGIYPKKVIKEYYQM